MKVHEIITEAMSTKPAGIAKTILRDCGPYLSMIGNKPTQYKIWRGTNDIGTVFSKNKCPFNRSPRDTDEEVHWVVDEWFLERTGIRFRSNATFGTGDYDVVVSNYGSPYIIFPIGEFSYCWSTKVADMTYDLFNPDEGEILGTEVKKIQSELKKSNYVFNESMRQAIESKHEIMLHCPNGYYAVAYTRDPDAEDFINSDEVLRIIEAGGVAKRPLGTPDPKIKLYKEKVAALERSLKYVSETWQDNIKQRDLFRQCLATCPSTEERKKFLFAKLGGISSDRILTDDGMAEAISGLTAAIVSLADRRFELTKKINSAQQKAGFA